MVGQGKNSRGQVVSAHSFSHWLVPSPTCPSLLALSFSPGSRESTYQVDTEAHGKEKSFQDGTWAADVADCKQNIYHSWTQWNFSSFFYNLHRLLTQCQELCLEDTELSSLITSTSLSKVFISPRMLCAPRELAWVIVAFLKSVLKTRCTDALVSSWCLQRTSFMLLCEHQGDRI